MTKVNELIMGLKNKEQVALEQVMEIWGTKIMHLAYYLLKDHQLAEDITQEVFITAYGKINQLKGQNLQAWLMAITTNLCRQRIRKWSWSKLRFIGEIEEELINIEYTGVNLVNQEIISLNLKEALLKLPLNYREVLILYYYLDLSIYEISIITKEKEGTIKSRLARGRNILKDLLGEDKIYDGFQG